MSLTTQARQARDKLRANIKSQIPENVYEITGYAPRPLQHEIEQNERRFNAEVLHRRFGKTVMKINKLIERAVECPFDDGRYAYIAPTYSMAEDIAWHYLLSYTEPFGEAREVSAGRLAVTIPTRRNGRSRIRLYGVDSPKQRLRGLYLDGVVFDEYAHIPPSVWSEQVRPMLSDDVRQGKDIRGRRNQWADFIFTPFGRNHAYTLHRNATLWYAGEAIAVGDEDSKTPVRRDDWYACIYRASETGVLTAAELRDALHDMGRSKYDQEYECSFDAAVEGAIFADRIEEIRDRGQIISGIGYEPLLPVCTAWDLGWDDATAIWFFQPHGNQIRVIDYYEASGAPLDHYADVLEAKGYRYGYHLLPHDIEVTELGTGKTRSSLLRQLGVRPTVVPQHRVEDGIEAARAVLPRCWFDASACADGLDRLALYRREWVEKTQTFRQKPVHDWASHGADAFRTLAVGLRRLSLPGEQNPNNSVAGVF